MPQVHDPAAFAAAYRLVAPAIGKGTGDQRFDEVLWLEATPGATRIHAGTGAAFITVEIPTLEEGDSWRSIVSVARNPLPQIAKWAANPRAVLSLFPDLEERVTLTKTPTRVEVELSGATPVGQSSREPGSLVCRDAAIDWPHDLIAKLAQHNPRATTGTIYHKPGLKFMTAVTDALPDGVPTIRAYSDGQAQKFEFTDPELRVKVTGVVFFPEPEPPSQVLNGSRRPQVFVTNQNLD